jgi:hypothetical protein
MNFKFKLKLSLKLEVRGFGVSIVITVLIVLTRASRELDEENLWRSRYHVREFAAVH